jgi:hypothetical protein
LLLSVASNSDVRHLPMRQTILLLLDVHLCDIPDIRTAIAAMPRAFA